MSNKMNRHDMLVEIISDYISQIEALAIQGDRAMLEEWLAPILHREEEAAFQNKDDSAVAAHYTAMLGTAPVGWEDQ